MAYLKEICCTDAKDFISKFSYGGEYYWLRTSKFIFRGEPSDQYSLIPSSLRKKNQTKIKELITKAVPDISKHDFNLSKEYDQILSEYVLLSMFFKKCDLNGLYVPDIKDFRLLVGQKTLLREVIKEIPFWLPLKYIELAGLAQHYGIYTRLLDWSRDINVALYFAVSGYMPHKNPKKSNNIVLWALNPDIGRSKEFDTGGLKIFSPQYNSNPNLCAQRGVFTLWQIKNDIKGRTDRRPLDELIEEFTISDIMTKMKNPLMLCKIYIPTREIGELVTYLKTSGYDSSRLFPGYGGAAQCVLNDI